MRWGEESSSHGFAVPVSFRQGAKGTGDADCEAGVRTGFAMTPFQEVRYKPGRADRGVRPYGSVTRGAMGGRPQGSPLRRGYR